MTTEKQAINLAFRALRKRGFIALQNHLCCGSCACADIAERVKKAGGDPETADWVAYHRQSADAFNPDGGIGPRPGLEWADREVRRSLFLIWGGDGFAICNALRDEGLAVEWDGTTARCIEVKGFRPADATLAAAASFAAECGVY